MAMTRLIAAARLHLVPSDVVPLIFAPAVFLLFLLHSAHAAVLQPPAQYAYEAANVTVRELPYRQVNRACRKHFGWMAQGIRGRIEGCTDPVERLIIMPTRDSVSAAKWQCIYRHEQAHIAGWPASHPNGRHSAECAE